MGWKKLFIRGGGWGWNCPHIELNWRQILMMACEICWYGCAQTSYIFVLMLLFTVIWPGCEDTQKSTRNWSLVIWNVRVVTVAPSAKNREWRGTDEVCFNSRVIISSFDVEVFSETRQTKKTFFQNMSKVQADHDKYEQCKSEAEVCWNAAKAQNVTGKCFVCCFLYDVRIRLHNCSKCSAMENLCHLSETIFISIVKVE